MLHLRTAEAAEKHRPTLVEGAHGDVQGRQHHHQAHIETGDDRHQGRQDAAAELWQVGHGEDAAEGSGTGRVGFPVAAPDLQTVDEDEAQEGEDQHHGANHRGGIDVIFLELLNDQRGRDQILEGNIGRDHHHRSVLAHRAAVALGNARENRQAITQQIEAFAAVYFVRPKRIIRSCNNLKNGSLLDLNLQVFL